MGGDYPCTNVQLEALRPWRPSRGADSPRPIQVDLEAADSAVAACDVGSSPCQWDELLATQTVLDERDEPPPFVETDIQALRTEDPAASPTGVEVGALDVDLDQMLQALLLHEGFLEDREIAPPEGARMLTRDSTRGTSGSLLVPASTREDMRTMSNSTATSARTLRDMRRQGPLGELSQEAQTTLLAGALYAYGEGGGSSGSNAPPSASPQQASRAGAPPPSLALGRSQALAAAALASARGASGAAVSHRNSSTREDPEEDSFNLNLASPTAGLTLSDLLQNSLDHILQFTHRDCPPYGRGEESSSRREEPPSGAQAHRPSGEGTDVLREAETILDTARTAASSLLGFTHARVSAQQGSHRRSATALSEEGSGGWPDSARSADSASVLGVSLDIDGGATARGRYGSGELALDIMDETASVWGFGDTVRSNLSTSRSNHSESLEMQQSARTPRAAGAAFEALDLAVLEQTLSIDGSLDGGLSQVLNRLALENLSLDESLSRSVRRVLQLGTVLTGQRLSEEEIHALPKVRFQDAEQQTCTICLEAYHNGELLTALSCGHFFHVECLGRWFRRSTLCPLCRANMD